MLPDSANWLQFQGLLRPVNQAWAANASALLMLAAQTECAGKTLHAHAFDVGAACAQLALQATALGWQAHVIGGFDRNQARALLRLPPSVVPQVMLAIGRAVGPQTPGERLPLREIAAEDRLDFGAE